MRAQGRAVVINADSAQVYADLAVLSARPTARRCGDPHRLFGEWDGAQACSAADWAAQARGSDRRCPCAGHCADPCRRDRALYAHPARRDRAGAADRPSDPGAGARHAGERSPCGPRCAKTRTAPPASPPPTPRGSPAHWKWSARPGAPCRTGSANASGGIGDRSTSTRSSCCPIATGSISRCDQRFDLMLANAGPSRKSKRCLPAHLDPALPVMRAIGVPEIAGYLRGEMVAVPRPRPRRRRRPATMPSGSSPGSAASPRRSGRATYE
jgi:tRNA dimethylallyltransferase